MRDKKTGALAGLDIAQRDQAIVCLDHGEGTDLELFGGGPDGRQAGALRQFGLLDQLREMLHQLTDSRCLLS